MHWTARRLLMALPDGTLAPEREAQVRLHMADCGRCRRRHAEIEMAEALLQRMPLSILPLEPHPSTHARLSRLARWTDEPGLPTPDRWRIPTLSVASLVAVVMVAFGVGRWSPLEPELRRGMTLAYLPQDSHSLPVVWRPGP